MRVTATHWVFAISTLAELALIGCVANRSGSFAFGSDELTRPIMTVVGLLIAATLAQWCALAAALRLSWGRKQEVTCFLIAVVLRILLLATPPIQEVDLNRYLWDGAVTAAGVSPYENSPEAVKLGDLSTDASARLKGMLDTEPGIRTVLDRVHYPQFTTVYPPVSQLVFAFSSWVTPATTEVNARVLIIKWVLLGFDIGTVFLIGRLIRVVGRHGAWVLLYGWSPLVIKEFSNSGHLDSIAIFFTVAAALTLLIAVKQSSGAIALASAALLALAVGAKLYPLVLIPVFFSLVLQRFARRLGVAWLGVAVAASLILLAPMLAHVVSPDPRGHQGLTVFLSHWEMNDLIFMLIQENLRPRGTVQGQPELWFVVLPDVVRTACVDWFSQCSGVEAERVPFLMARACTLALFSAIVVRLIGRKPIDGDRFCESLFLVLAWFWFLSPTQNPWYWIWGLPFAACVRNRAWHLVSAMTLLYYMRFWFLYHDPEWTFSGSVYRGAQVFDFLIVWIEHLPVLILLGVVLVAGSNRKRLAKRLNA